MTAPLSHAGIDLHCPRCGAQPGQPCRSNTGRVLKETHLPRARAAWAANPVRAWFAERNSWRSA